LYCEAADNSKRLAIVAVLQEVSLLDLVEHHSHQASHIIRKIIAPIAPHLAEELHEHAGGKDSVFLDTWKDGVGPPSVGMVTPADPAGRPTRCGLGRGYEGYS